MKKTILPMLLLILTVSPLYASADGRVKQGPGSRSLRVIGRGLANLVALPLEISSTVVREREMHPKTWPAYAAFPGRIFTNLAVRSASVVNDVVALPWAALFTDDLSPLSEGMGLPEYAWQIH